MTNISEKLSEKLSTKYICHTKFGHIIKETSDIREVFALILGGCEVTIKQPGLQLIVNRGLR